MTGRVWTIETAWQRLPLSLNDRGHWAKTYRAKTVVVDEVITRIRAARIPYLIACRVVLHYVPATRRTRDLDNAIATYKPCCDAVVRAGVVADDNPMHMEQVMPVIHEPERDRKVRVWLTIEEPSDV